MTLPTFLGIGVQRAGTTWLHELLASHPDVYMPTRRKEIRFFEKYYDQGPGWYATFFPPPQEAEKYRAIGEISTQYYDCEACPQRIFNLLPQSKLIIMLRHPVKRAYSHYGFIVQRKNFRGSFEDFLASRPKMLEKGFYSRYLTQYLRYFDRTQILALLFEEVFLDPRKTQTTIADFLDIDAERFPSSAPNGKVNASSVPKFRSLFRFAKRTGHHLRSWHLEPLVDFMVRLGLLRALAKGKSLPRLEEEQEKELNLLYQEEFDELEQCLQIDLSAWRKQGALKVQA